MGAQVCVWGGAGAGAAVPCGNEVGQQRSTKQEICKLPVAIAIYS